MTSFDSYRPQSRGGVGVKTANVTAKTGNLIGAKIINPDTKADMIMISKSGQVIRINVKDIPSIGRATQGVYLMRLRGSDIVASISMVDHIDEDITAPEETDTNTAQQELIASE